MSGRSQPEAEQKSPKARRGRDEGSLYERPDGRWEAIVSLGTTATGKRRRRRMICDTKREAQAALATLRARHAAGTPEERRTVKAVAAEWIENHVRPNMRANSIRNYAHAVNKHIVPHLGHVPIAKLSAGHVRAWLGDLDRDGLGSRMRQHAHEVLHRLLAEAKRWKYITTNVAAEVPRPRHEPRKHITWSGADLARFIEHHRDHRMLPMVVLAVSSGLRKAELLGLHWTDIDLARGHVTVSRQLVRTAEGYADGPPKTRSSYRRVDLPELALEWLRVHQARMTEEGQGGPRVFVTTAGKPITDPTIHRWWDAMRKAVAVPQVQFHELRHSSATILLEAGVHPKVVQERLGHAEIATTLDTYSHVLPRLHREAANQLDEALRRRPTGDLLVPDDHQEAGAAPSPPHEKRGGKRSL